ncbi:polysaccharide biosynthesis tyrosine autokinase [Streptomyces sp. GC420]|uniref:polysaccharide biosynthesis tyrosine autokinase n=1 Tax=Streptomyces sp. GC420 TaxID=2697568 RepID=UPI0014152045|nr:polysaccharide biosynthesis tyrosine autokinase [Streptomyces sp. GC420]NBM17518.1 polysaccharide biosynthesis tyrosine autokinase [Streptomyces sp. GC420]
MELRTILRALARSWPVVAVCALLGVGAGWAATALTTPVYEARTQLFVSAPWSGDITQLAQGNVFSLARVQSYASIVTSPQVTAPVVKELGLDTTPEELAGRITAEAPLETVLVNITVSDTDPRRAARTANAVATRFSLVIERLETPRGSDSDRAPRPPVKLGITQSASVPPQPVSPRPALNLSLGLLAGLLLGGGVTVARERLDTTLKTADALAEHTGLPVLGAIPLDKPSADESPVVAALGHSARAEAFRHLRTNLQFARIGERPRVIVVTSSLPGEGKTSTATALALSLADSGTSTCLVDADLRRPCVARSFGLIRDAGLTNVLIGQASIEDVMQQAAGRLAVLASGPMPPNPTELLASVRMGEVLQELAERYEAVIVDSAPLLPVADTVGLASLAQGAVLVVQAGRTPRERVGAAADSLQTVGVRTLGTVLSMAPSSRRAGYGYGYGYGDPSAAEQTAMPPRPRAEEQGEPEQQTEPQPAGSAKGRGKRR